jgi:tetratricopeptide (TPR) repeat protein
MRKIQANMNSKGTKLVWAFLLLVLSIQVFSQAEYELLYLQRQYDEIAEKSSGLVSAEDYRWNGIATRLSGDLAGSIQITGQGLDAYPGDRELEMLLGDLYFSAGRYSAAKPILVKYQDNREYFLKLIRVLEFESEHSRAITLLKNKLAEDTLDIEYLGKLADNYLKVDSVSDAKIVLKTLISLDSADQRSLARLANVHLESKEYAEAIMVCNRLLEIDSTNLTVHRIKGFSSFRNGMFPDARKSFMVLYDHGDSGKVVLKHLGICEIKEYKYSDARKHLLQLFAMDSTDHEVCFFLGRAFLNSGDPLRGLYFLDRADSLAQPDPQVMTAIYIEKVTLYTALNMYAEAVSTYEKAYAYNPKPEYLFFMASSYEFNLNNKKKALELYEKFIKCLPSAPAESDDPTNAQRSMSMKEIALRKISSLREDLFFLEDLDTR